MPCQLRPDEWQHGCNQGSNKGEAPLGLRLEAAGTVGCRPSEYRIGAAYGQNDPCARLRARQTPGLEDAESVLWTLVRSGKSHLGNVGLGRSPHE